VELMPGARPFLPVVMVNLCTSLALRRSTLHCGSCWYVKGNSETEHRRNVLQIL